MAGEPNRKKKQVEWQFLKKEKNIVTSRIAKNSQGGRKERERKKEDCFVVLLS